MDDRLLAIAASGKTQLGLRRSRSLGILPGLGQIGIELQSVHEVDHDEWEVVLCGEERAALAEWDAFQAELEAMPKPCLHEQRTKEKPPKPGRRTKAGPRPGTKNSRTVGPTRLPPKSPVGRGPYEVKAKAYEDQLPIQPRLKTSLQRRRSNSHSALPQLKNNAGLPVLHIWEEERRQLNTEGAPDVFLPPPRPMRKAPGHKSSATEEMEKLLLNTDAIVNDYKVELERRKHQKRQTEAYTGPPVQQRNLLESYKELQANMGEVQGGARDIDMAMRQLSIQDVTMINAPGALPPPPPPPFTSSFTPHQQNTYPPPQPLYSPNGPHTPYQTETTEFVFVDEHGVEIDISGQPLDALGVGALDLEPLSPMGHNPTMGHTLVLDDMSLPDYPQPILAQPPPRPRHVPPPRQQTYITDVGPRHRGRSMQIQEGRYGGGLSMGGQEVILVQTLPPRHVQSMDPQGNIRAVRRVPAGGMGGMQPQGYMQPPPRRVVYTTQPQYEPIPGGSLEQPFGNGSRQVLQQAPPRTVQVRVQQNPTPQPIHSQRPGKAHTIGGPYMGMGGLDSGMELDLGGSYGPLDHGPLDMDPGMPLSNPPTYRHRASSGSDVMPRPQYTTRFVRTPSPTFGFIAPDPPRMTLNQSGRGNLGVAHPVAQPTLSSIVREMLEDPNVLPPKGPMYPGNQRQYE